MYASLFIFFVHKYRMTVDRMALYHVLTEINEKTATGNSDLSDINDNTTEAVDELEFINDKLTTANSWLTEIDSTNATIVTNTGNIATSTANADTSLGTINTSNSTIATQATLTNTKLDTANTTLTSINSNIGGTKTRTMKHFEWSNTTETTYAGPADYTTTNAKGTFLNNTGASIFVKRIFFGIHSADSTTQWGIDNIFSGTDSGRQLYIGTDTAANQTANGVTTRYLNLRNNLILGNFNKGEVSHSNSSYCMAYTLDVSFEVSNNDYASISYKENTSADTSFQFFAAIEYE